MVLAWTLRTTVALVKWTVSTTMSGMGLVLILVVLLMLLGAGRHFLLDVESEGEEGSGETPKREGSTVSTPTKPRQPIARKSLAATAKLEADRQRVEALFKSPLQDDAFFSSMGVQPSDLGASDSGLGDPASALVDPWRLGYDGSLGTVWRKAASMDWWPCGQLCIAMGCGYGVYTWGGVLPAGAALWAGCTHLLPWVVGVVRASVVTPTSLLKGPLWRGAQEVGALLGEIWAEEMSELLAEEPGTDAPPPPPAPAVQGPPLPSGMRWEAVLLLVLAAVYAAGLAWGACTKPAVESGGGERVEGGDTPVSPMGPGGLHSHGLDSAMFGHTSQDGTDTHNTKVDPSPPLSLHKRAERSWEGEQDWTKMRWGPTGTPIPAGTPSGSGHSTPVDGPASPSPRVGSGSGQAAFRSALAAARLSALHRTRQSASGSPRHSPRASPTEPLPPLSPQAPLPSGGGVVYSSQTSAASSRSGRSSTSQPGTQAPRPPPGALFTSSTPSLAPPAPILTGSISLGAAAAVAPPSSAARAHRHSTSSQGGRAHSRSRTLAGLPDFAAAFGELSPPPAPRDRGSEGGDSGGGLAAAGGRASRLAASLPPPQRRGGGSGRNADPFAPLQAPSPAPAVEEPEHGTQSEHDDGSAGGGSTVEPSLALGTFGSTSGSAVSLGGTSVATPHPRPPPRFPGPSPGPGTARPPPAPSVSSAGASSTLSSRERRQHRRGRRREDMRRQLAALTGGK